MNRKPSLLQRLHNREYRESLVSSLINSTIANQIRALRKQKDLDQSELGELAGMKQTAISRLENPDYGNLSVNTLKRIARAFDVALIVRFAPYSEVVRWRSTMSQREMTPASYDEDLELWGDSDTRIIGKTILIGRASFGGRVSSRDVAAASTAVKAQLSLGFDGPASPPPNWENGTASIRGVA